MEYLDFELPIKELEDQLDKCQIIGEESNVDVASTCKQIEKKLEETKKKIYKKSFCLATGSAFPSSKSSLYDGSCKSFVREYFSRTFWG